MKNLSSYAIAYFDDANLEHSSVALEQELQSCPSCVQVDD
jgi:hypothetical protein